MVTGILLGFARISGETAPLLFTALNNQFLSTDMGNVMANLPMMIFQYAMSPYSNWQELAWAGALLDRKSTRLNSSHVRISYAVFCLKKKKKRTILIMTDYL